MAESSAKNGDAMHIMEGFLPHPWWEIWFALSLPVVAFGVYKMNMMIKENRETLPLLAVAGAFVFVLSSLKLPSVTGSCSHPTGTGMGAIIFGPWITSVLAVIVLVYQAVFLAHGGLTTLGANTFSMGIAGPVVGYLVYKAASTSRAASVPGRFPGGDSGRLGHLSRHIHSACSGLSGGLRWSAGLL